MAEARCRADWARTSALMALAVNLVRDPRRTPAAKPNDFNPYAPRPKKPILRGKQLEILRDVFVKSQPGHAPPLGPGRNWSRSGATG